MLADQIRRSIQTVYHQQRSLRERERIDGRAHSRVLLYSTSSKASLVFTASRTTSHSNSSSSSSRVTFALSSVRSYTASPALSVERPIHRNHSNWPVHEDSPRSQFLVDPSLIGSACLSSSFRLFALHCSTLCRTRELIFLSLERHSSERNLKNKHPPHRLSAKFTAFFLSIFDRPLRPFTTDRTASSRYLSNQETFCSAPTWGDFEICFAHFASKKVHSLSCFAWPRAHASICSLGIIFDFMSRVSSCFSSSVVSVVVYAKTQTVLSSLPFSILHYSLNDLSQLDDNHALQQRSCTGPDKGGCGETCR